LDGPSRRTHTHSHSTLSVKLMKWCSDGVEHQGAGEELRVHSSVGQRAALVSPLSDLEASPPEPFLSHLSQTWKRLPLSPFSLFLAGGVCVPAARARPGSHPGHRGRRVPVAAPTQRGGVSGRAAALTHGGGAARAGGAVRRGRRGAAAGTKWAQRERESNLILSARCTHVSVVSGRWGGARHAATRFT
jgi:hypothetical protein